MKFYRLIAANAGIAKEKSVFSVINANAITHFANFIDFLKNIIAISISKQLGKTNLKRPIL